MVKRLHSVMCLKVFDIQYLLPSIVSSFLKFPNPLFHLFHIRFGRSKILKSNLGFHEPISPDLLLHLMMFKAISHAVSHPGLCSSPPDISPFPRLPCT